MTERVSIAVRDVMTPSPYTIDGLASVQEALDLMRRHDVSSVVIDRRHEGDEFGILVVHDIATAVVAENRSPARTSVYEVMSKPVLTINVAMDIRYAIRLLARFGLSRALVTDHGQLVGIVTLRDMVFRFLPGETSRGEPT
jgi:CBS domain-containing protein